MPLDFPTSPAVNEIYTFGGRSWIWNGTAWDVYSTVGGNVVTQLNGLTGGVTLAAGSNITLSPVGNTITIASTGGGGGISGPYVISLRGLTGAVGFTNGSGIGLSVSGQTMTFSNTGVLSIDGGTGAITNVAKTDVNNFFSASQTVQLIDPELVVYNSDNDNSVTIYSNKLFQSTNSGSDQDILFSPTNPPNTVTFPDFTTTLAGLAGTQTFTGTKTFNALTNFPGGISAAGATFSSLARFNAGISAAGATLSSITTIPSGATLSVLGNITGNVVNSINGITGAVNLAAGSNITITPSGLTLTIAAGAGFSRSINVITTSTTAGATSNVDYVYIGNTSGNINLTLPTAVSNTNRYTVKNSNIGILTVLTTSSQTIDGITGYNLSKQFQAIDLLSDNSNWVVV